MVRALQKREDASEEQFLIFPLLVKRVIRKRGYRVAMLFSEGKTPLIPHRENGVFSGSHTMAGSRKLPTYGLSDKYCGHCVELP